MFHLLTTLVEDLQRFQKKIMSSAYPDPWLTVVPRSPEP